MSVTPVPSTSTFSPYTLLPPATKRSLQKKIPLSPDTLSLLDQLNIDVASAQSRLSNTYLHLSPPEGKVTDARKQELAKREARIAAKKEKREREGECGLVGRRKRAKYGADRALGMSYDAALALHNLWLSYMAELLALPILLPASTSSASSTSAATGAPPAASAPAVTSFLLPSFPPRQQDPAVPSAAELRINVNAIQTKMIKAEFVGCKLTVKRAKNPSLVALTGIVLQETQGTFKIVTAKSAIKVVPKQHSIFTVVLPLSVPPASSNTEASREVSFDVYGDAFNYRSADRVGKKWKAGGGTGGVEL